MRTCPPAGRGTQYICGHRAHNALKRGRENTAVPASVRSVRHGEPTLQHGCVCSAWNRRGLAFFDRSSFFTYRLQAYFELRNKETPAHDILISHCKISSAHVPHNVSPSMVPCETTKSLPVVAIPVAMRHDTDSPLRPMAWVGVRGRQGGADHEVEGHQKEQPHQCHVCHP